MATLKKVGLAVLFISSVALAGSDGPYFPIANITGVLMLFGLTLILGRVNQ